MWNLKAIKPVEVTYFQGNLIHQNKLNDPLMYVNPKQIGGYDWEIHMFTNPNPQKSKKIKKFFLKHCEKTKKDG